MMKLGKILILLIITMLYVSPAQQDLSRFQKQVSYGDMKDLREKYEEVGTLMQNNKFKEAVEPVKELVEYAEKLFTSHDKRLLNAFYYATLVYMQLDQPENAEPYVKRMIEIAEEHFVKENKDRLAGPYSLMGSIYLQQEKYKEALDIFKKIYDLTIETNKDDTEKVTSAKISLANVYSELKQWEKAEKEIKECIDMQLKANGAESPAYAGVIQTHGSLYEDMGKYDKAIELQKKATDIYKKSDPKSLDYAYALSRLASYYEEQYRWDESFDLREDAMKITQRKEGRKSLMTAQKMLDFGQAIERKWDYKKAKRLIDRARKIALDSLEEGNIARAGYDLRYISNNMVQGEMVEALPIIEKTVKAYDSSFGEDYVSSVYILSYLSWMYYEYGKTDEMKEVNERIRKLLTEKELNPEKKSSVRFFSILASINDFEGNTEKAAEFAQKSFDAAAKHYPADTEPLYEPIVDLAEMQMKAGMADKAETNLNKAKSILSKRFKDDSPFWQNYYYILGGIEKEKGNADKAIEYLKKSLDMGIAKFGIDNIRSKDALELLAEVAADKGDSATETDAKTRLGKVKSIFK